MATTSTTATEAAKKRGRPKKGAIEAAATSAAKKVGVKVAGAKEKATKALDSKKAPARTAAKPGRILHDSAIPSQTSKIIQAVRATGTLDKADTAAMGKADTIASPQTSTAPTPATPSNTSIPDSTAQPQPIPRPTSTHPSSPPPTSKRTTTIPLPPRPRLAPSPNPSSPSLAKPALPSSTASTHHQQQHNPPRAPPPRMRVIEPTPDIRLPPKYKPAARKVTSIIVGIPIIIVVGLELYSRWKGEVRKKWGEKGERI